MSADAVDHVDFRELIDLASERLGGAVIAASDEFFAPKERLLRGEAPVWREGEYTDRGKWMDGWETRRRRDVLPWDPGFPQAHDWCIIRLGAPGVVRGVDVDTAHFKGNFPESCAIDACLLPAAAGAAAVAAVAAVADVEQAAWREVMPRSPLRGDSHHLFPVSDAGRASHLRLRIFPDGGVARLRVHGQVAPDWEELRRAGELDLAAALHGGFVVACSDMFFGSRNNLVMPGDARSMADGWETKRRRTPGHDWTIVRLGAPGTVARIEVDTSHFKGNAPGACSVEGCVVPSAQQERAWDPAALMDWREMLPRTPLEADARHRFDVAARSAGRVTHVRFNIFPDGGVARLRLVGRPA